MSAFAGANTDKVLNDEGRVAEDVPCLGCAYNLRGLKVTGDCPECGRAIADSLRGDRLRFADARWLRGVHRGLTCVIAAVILSFAWTVVWVAANWLGAPRNQAFHISNLDWWLSAAFFCCIAGWMIRRFVTRDDGWTKPILIVALAMLLLGVVGRKDPAWFEWTRYLFSVSTISDLILALGFWWITVPQPRRTEPPSEPYMRWVSRVAWLLLLAFPLFRSLPDGNFFTWTSTLVIYSSIGLFAMAGPFLLLSRIARRIPSDRLARHCLIALALIIAEISSLTLDNILLIRSTPAPTGMTIVANASGLITLIAGIWRFIVPVIFLSRVGECLRPLDD